MKKNELVLITPILLLAMLLVVWLYLILQGKHTKKSALAPREEVAVVIDLQDVEALALNIYHETRGLRGENDEGWRAVTAVVFNRLNDKRFPKRVRDVVFERNPRAGTCAFSWYCDGFSDTPQDSRVFEEARKAARQYLTEYHRGTWIDVTGGAHSYHSTRVPPNQYFERLRVTKVVWNEFAGHYFYSDPL